MDVASSKNSLPAVSPLPNKIYRELPIVLILINLVWIGYSAHGFTLTDSEWRSSALALGFFWGIPLALPLLLIAVIGLGVTWYRHKTSSALFLIATILPVISAALAMLVGIRYPW